MSKQGGAAATAQATARTGRGTKTARAGGGGSLSADDIREQVAAMLQQMEKTVEAEYHAKFSSSVKSMEERIGRTAQAQFDAVTKNIESANAAMEQVQQYHQSAMAELRATRQDMERASDPRAEYKATVDQIMHSVDDQIAQMRKKYKLS